MNWDLLVKLMPPALRAARTIYDALADGVDNAEVRRRLASADLILDDEIDALRDARDDLDAYVRTGR